MEILLAVVKATLLGLGLVHGAVYYSMCQRRHVPNRYDKGDAHVYRLRNLHTLPVIATVGVSAVLMTAPLLNVTHHPIGVIVGSLLGYGAWQLHRIVGYHQEPIGRLLLRCIIILVAWIAIDVILGGQPSLTRTSALMVGMSNVPAVIVLSLHANGIHDSKLIGHMRAARLALRVVALVTLLTMHPWIRTLCSHGCAPTLDWIFGSQSKYLVWVLAAVLIVGTAAWLWYIEHRPVPPPRIRKGA